MKDVLFGLILGYWIRDNIDPEKLGIKEPEQVPQHTDKASQVSDLSTGLELVVISLGGGLITLLIGWYILTFFSVLGFIVGIGLMFSGKE